MNSRLRSVRDWLELAHKADFQAAGLARECNVSVRQIERFFMMTFGKPPKRWLDELRQRQAVGLIEHGKPIKEISYQLGYKQPSHFSKAFKRAHGMAPSSMRNDSTPGEEVAFGYGMSGKGKPVELTESGWEGLLRSHEHLHSSDNTSSAHSTKSDSPGP